MRRMLRRVVSAVLSFLLVVSLAVPVPVTAATARELEQQIVRTYQQAKAHYGWSSFDGWCGALVNVQLYLLGITTNVMGNNGNEEFDAFYGQSTSSGGYSIGAYPAKTHSLLQALNEITENGTRDAYNILVGFQKTRSSLGSRYGHACVIHGIVGGMVCYVESYDLTIAGRYYPEGTPIVCSIEEFARYYESTTVLFDGVIHFSQPGYSDLCRSYPSRLFVDATGGVLRSQPCDASVDESSKQVRRVSAGEQLTVTGLYLNTRGEYWYQIGEEGYLPANSTRLNQLLYDDITISQPTAPAVLRQGKGYKVEGVISADSNSIYTVRTQVYRLEGEEQSQVISAVETVEGKHYDLSGSDISKDLTFRKLPAGQYRYDVAAIVSNHYVQGDRLQVSWETVALWSSQFQVVEDAEEFGIVSFDPCGGTVTLDQTTSAVGQKLDVLPQAQRDGFVFLGWYTQEQGGDPVDGSTVLQEDISLYAHWISVEELYAACYDRGQCLYYYSDGLTTMGSIEVDGLVYYFSAMNHSGDGQVMWTAAGAAE